MLGFVTSKVLKLRGSAPDTLAGGGGGGGGGGYIDILIGRSTIFVAKRVAGEGGGSLC